MNFLLIFLFIHKFKQLSCIGSKLTLEISPSLYDNPVFSYFVEVQCIDLNGKKWQHLYGSIWKNFPSHSFISEDGTKTVEVAIIQFENHVCRQFDILIKVLKWLFQKESITAQSSSRVALVDGTGGQPVYYIEEPVIYGSVVHKIDFGKYFSIKIVPLLEDEALYEVKLYCNENEKLIWHFNITAKTCQKGCSRMVFLKKFKCSTDEYDITVWKWNSQADKAPINRSDVGIYYSKLFIAEGHEQLIHYDLKHK